MLAVCAEVLYGPIISEAAKKFKGCYTRYVNNYDEVRSSSSSHDSGGGSSSSSSSSGTR